MRSPGRAQPGALTGFDGGLARLRAAAGAAISAAAGAAGLVLGTVARPWQRLDLWVRTVMPKGLYARSLLIIILPMVVLQSVVAFLFMDRQWSLVTRYLSSTITQEIAALIDVYKTYPQGADRAQLRRIAQDRLGLVVDFLPETQLPPLGPKPFFSQLDQSLSDEIRKLGFPFWIDTLGRSSIVEIRIKLPDTIMRVFARRADVYDSQSWMFLIWMVGDFARFAHRRHPVSAQPDQADRAARRRRRGVRQGPRGAQLPAARRARGAARGGRLPGNERARRALDRTAHHHARRRLARSAHRAHPLQARTRFARRHARDRGHQEGRRRDGRDAGGLSRLRARRHRRAVGADQYGGLARRIETRRRAPRPSRQRRLPRPAGGDGAAGGVQALPRQSRLQCRALCRYDCHQRHARSPLADGDRR